MEKFPEPNSLDSMEGVPDPVSTGELEKNAELGDSKASFEQPPILEISPDMWQKYKELRLRSGETDPQAWGESIRTEPEKDEAYWRNKFEDPNFKMFAIEMDGRFVAMGGLQKKTDGRFFGRRLYVDLEHRGRGLARILLQKILDEAKSSGAESVYLGVTEGIPALKLYKSMGFVEIDKHKNRVRGDGIPRDEIILEKKFE